MTTKQLLAGLAVLAAASSAQAVTVLSEGFDSVAALPGLGWSQVNNSAAPLGSGWFQGNSGIFPAYAGAADSYAAANFLSTGSAAGAISNWLILPTLTLDSSSVLSFQVRNGGDTLLDRLEVRFSANGGSADVGTTTSSVGDFSILLGTYASDTAGGWVGLSYSMWGLSAPTTGRLAFRYVVDDVSTAGNYLGVDSVLVTAVPEPATYVLMALGVAGLMLRRRAAA